MSNLDILNRAKEMQKDHDHGVKEDDIAQKYGVSTSTVSGYLLIARSPEYHPIFLDNKIQLQALQRLCRIKDKHRQPKVLRRAKEIRKREDGKPKASGYGMGRPAKKGLVTEQDIKQADAELGPTR